MRTWVAGLAAAVVMGRAAPSPQSPTAEALAAIRLTVVDDETGKPVNGVEVAARVPGTVPRAAFNSEPGPHPGIPEGVSNLRGEVFLAGVPARRVCIEANKPGYEASACTPPDVDEKRTLTLTAGEVRERVVLRLVRVGGVTGRIEDETGEPVVGVEVTAFRGRWSARGRSYVPAGTARTDDTGAYRISGLIAGAYLIGLQPRFEERAPQDANPRDAADENSAMDDPPTQAGFDVAGHHLMPSDPCWPLVGGDVAYGPAFAPGVPARDASLISLARGEWKNGVDVTISPTKFARLTGRIAMPAGVALSRAFVSLTPADSGDRKVFSDVYTASTDSSGSFAVPFVRPGTYQLFVQAVAAGADPRSVRSTTPTLTGHVQVVVSEPAQMIAVPVEPDGPVEGRVIVDSGPTLPEHFRGFNVMFTGLEADLNVVMSVSTAPDGRLSIEHVTPNTYAVDLFGQPGLAVSSVIANGRNVTDELFHLEPGAAPTELILHVTDKLPSVAGVVDSSESTIDTSAWVVIFSADRSFWKPRSRRVIALHPTIAGEFEFKNLLPGGYLMAVAHLEAESWRDPDVLASLVTSAKPITISEGDHATVHLNSPKR